MSTKSYFTFLWFILSCLIISFSNALNNGFSVELIHRDSPKSPLYKPTQNKYQRVINAFQRSINRVNHFYNDSLANTPQSTVYFDDRYEYLMSYSIGTPAFKVYAIVDTGSSLVWLQCKPCEQCYPQTTHIFNPSFSSSFEHIPCISDTCHSWVSTFCTNQGFCEYTSNYMDGSFSRGHLSSDTITLDSTSGNSVSFPKIVIGCGYRNRGPLFNGATSGIVGLGNGPLSLITQLQSTIHGKFSYCLVPWFKDVSNFTSKLNFGDAVVVDGDGAVTTPLVKHKFFYYLTLEGFSVGDKFIKFQGSPIPDVGNIVIDSGTTYMLIPSDDYNRLESAVAEYINLKRVEDPNHIFGLCYNLEFEVPLITAHFKGADVKLHSGHTFVPIGDGIVCLAFIPSNFAIFGNVAQRSFLIGFDVIQNTVTFKQTSCVNI